MKDCMNLKSKLLFAMLGLIFASSSQAKTISLLCETLAGARSPIAAGPGFTVPHSGRDASYSTWSVTIETDDDDGKIKKVFLDNDEKEFELKGDLLKFRAKLIFSLEINLKTARARTTATGIDTREQGACKVISKTEKGLLE
jgi:hypothetical protein